MAAARPLYLTDLAYIHHEGFGGLSRDAAPALRRILRSHGLRGARIVEAGCGSGILAKSLVQAGHRVVGIDASPAMIALARKHAPGARFRVASLTATAIPRCDVVVAVGEVITYLPSWRAVQRFIARVHDALPPGGLFLFDFIESGERRTFPPRSRGGADWAIVTRADLSADRRVLTRRMTTFRKLDGAYRQSRETHRVRIYPRARMAEELSRAGFTATLRRSFGACRLLVGDVAVVAERR